MRFVAPFSGVAVDPGAAAVLVSGIPADRVTAWNPGLYPVGGIPTFSSVFTTLSPLAAGADNTAQIQSALNSAGAVATATSPQVVQLSAGTFNMSGSSGVTIGSSYVVLRGAGAGVTVLNKTGTSSASGGNVGSAGPAVTISGPGTYDLSLTSGGVNTSPAALGNLTAALGNGDKGTYTVAVDSVSGFSVGDLVRLDRLSGAVWKNDPRFGSTSANQVWASPDWLVVWKRSNPQVPGDDMGPSQDPADPAFFYTAYTVPDRPVCEMKEIAAVNASAKTVTFTTPLHISYKSVNGARIIRYNATVVQFSGVENLTAYGFDRGSFAMYVAKYCWFKNLEVDFWYDKPYNLNAAFRCEVRHCYGHGTPWPSNSAENYQFILNWASADCLVEDCISILADKVTAARAAGAGCVFGYNYLDMGYIGFPTQDTWVEIGANASHLVGPHHVLFEGNYCFNADSDYTHGSTTYVTHLRNWYSGYRHQYNDPVNSNVSYDDWLGNGAGATFAGNGVKRCAAGNEFSYWHTFVGNVLGWQGRMSGWQYEELELTQPASIWRAGWQVSASIQHNSDPQVLNNAFPGYMIRDGNWDWLNSQQRWHNTPATFPIANSLYLSPYLVAGKPAFFGAFRWPWVDPSTGATYSLPAKARWEAGVPNDASLPQAESNPHFVGRFQRPPSLRARGQDYLSNTGG